MDEFERITRLRQRFAGASAHVVLGIGDDAAVLRGGPSDVVISVDSAVEGVHFDRAFGSWRVLAARAFTAAVSDLAAMGATPRAALSSLIVPRELEAGAFDELNAGLADAAARYACPIVGGNLAAGRELSLTTTVIGAVDGPALTRSAARPGDAIYVTGSLGGAALGLHLLQLSAAETAPAFVERWQKPCARIAEGQRLRAVAHAAIDVSDGALQDLGHICEASGFAAELEVERLPLPDGLRELARELGQDPLALALLGGEDYELIYTLPSTLVDPAAGTRIGRMLDVPGTPVLIDAAGKTLALPGRGYRHFG